MTGKDSFEVTATVWLWTAAGKERPMAWHFLTIDGQTSAEIRYATLGRSGGFGSIPVAVRIGTTRWRTSIFPHRDSGGYILPIKADVRKREGIVAGDEVAVSLAI
jgi:hypothetical protein